MFLGDDMIFIYDFDGTLTPFAIPKFEILEKCGMVDGAHNPKFMELVKENAKEKNIDLYSSIYEVYFKLIKDAGFSLIDDNLCLGSKDVVYNKGVVEFLTYLNSLEIKNYVVSSGPKVFLEETSISSLLNGIYGSTFVYDNDGAIIGVDYLMSDKNKVEIIKSIVKLNGLDDSNCSNVVYIGDGLTDSYAMEYVKSNGGTSIFVYKDENSKGLKSMEERGIISYSAFADFSSDSGLFNYVKKLIIK